MNNKITIEFSIAEARILCNILASANPQKNEELISFMLYARIKRRIDDEIEKNEFL